MIGKVLHRRNTLCLLCFISMIFALYQLFNSLLFNHTLKSVYSSKQDEIEFISGHKKSFVDEEPPGPLTKKKSTTTTMKPKIKMKPDDIRRVTSKSFISSLSKFANKEKQIMISVVDYGFLDFALNFKEISVDRYNISNFLLVCTDKHSYEELKLRGIYCCPYDYGSASGNKASDFATSEYYEKTNVKTAIVIQVLNLGYSILIIDLDVVLFQNPFPHFECSDCDIHIQLDRDTYNSGFVYVRPTVNAKTFYDTAWHLYVTYQKAHDQAYVNMAASVLKNENRLPKIHSLSTRQFVCGVYYFEHGNRMFENKPSCSECVMAHNNYLGSVAAKIYRFKENHFWMVDKNDYYSNSVMKYLTYENPVDFDLKTREIEVDALRTALTVAQITNRILILPSFRCCICNEQMKCSHPMHRCSLLSVLRVKLFDEKFHDLYREHSFLNHPKVPFEVKDSVSRCIVINSTLISSNLLSTNCTVFQPSDSKDGATVEEIERWLEPYQNVSIIRFHSLYGALSRKQFDAVKRFERLRLLLDEGFKCSEYEQWEESHFKF